MLDDIAITDIIVIQGSAWWKCQESLQVRCSSDVCTAMRQLTSVPEGGRYSQIYNLQQESPRA